MGVDRSGFDRALKKFYNEADDKKGGIETRLASVASVTGLSLADEGFGGLRKYTFTFTDVDFALVDNAGTIAYTSNKILDLAEGAVLIIGCVADLVCTKSSAGVDADADVHFGVGTTAANNTATLATTEQNIIATSTNAMSTGSVALQKQGGLTATPFDGTSTAVDIYVNMLVADADHDVTTTPCNLILNGTLTLWAMNLGDY